MSVQRLREQSLSPGTDSELILGLAEDKIAGYAFATRWQYEGRQMCWVTQLCVSPEHRGKKLATNVCFLSAHIKSAADRLDPFAPERGPR